MKKKYILMFVLLLLVIVSLLVYVLFYKKNYYGYKEQTINLYTNVSYNILEPFINEYSEKNKIYFNVINLTKDNFKEEIANNINQKELANVLIVNVELLIDLSKNLELMQLDKLIKNQPVQFTDQKKYQWLGLWYDPLVFVANADMNSKIKQGDITWIELPWHDNWRIAMNDCLSTEAYGNVLYYISKAKGLEQTINYFQLMRKSIVKYSNFLDVPVRMLSLGECDLAIAMQSEAFKYIADGFPLYVLYPNDGTPYLLTAAALINQKDQTSEKGEDFLNWLLSEEAQKIMVEKNFPFIMVASSKQEQCIQHGLKLLQQDYEIDQKLKVSLLKRWANEVRFFN